MDPKSPLTWLETTSKTSTELDSLLSSLSASASSSSSTSSAPPEIKSYSDAIYHNHYSLGLSLLFTPNTPSHLTSFDIYNSTPAFPTTSEPTTSKPPKKSKPSPYSPYPSYPLIIPFTTPPFNFSPASVGLDFVNGLGEPGRKGGGENGVGIWCEWIWKSEGRGLMVEFASEGLGKWDKGAQAGWTVASFFKV